MAKYRVLKRFRDIETDETYEVNQEIELTNKRAKEIVKNLKSYGGNFIEEIQEDEEDPGNDKPKEDEKPTEPKKEEAKEDKK